MSARVTFALVRAGVRHRRELADTVDEELARWRRQAQAIPAGRERTVALAKLDGETGHARAATMMATLAPGGERVALARTILAVEVLYDHLDGRSEPTPAGDPLDGRRTLLGIFEDACSMRPARVPADAADGAYLAEVSCAASEGLAALPAIKAVRAELLEAARRAVEAQALMHAAADVGSGALEAWGRAGSGASGLDWREYLAGCGASVLCVHALALRASRTEGPPPQVLDSAYLHLGALATLLDGLIDGVAEPGGAPSYSSLYEGAGEVALAILELGSRARGELGALGPSDQMMLAGVLAHYSTLAGAGSPAASATLAALREPERLPVALAARALRRGRDAAEPESGPVPTIRASDEPAAG